MTTKTTHLPKIWLSSPHMGGTEQKYVQQAFDTNWIAPLGPNVNGFEKDLANYTGAKVSLSFKFGYGCPASGNDNAWRKTG